MKKAKFAIILLGQPGAGKGTQADLLAEKFKLKKIETSKLIRAKFKQSPNASDVKTAKADYDSGKLISDELTTKWVLEYIKGVKKGVVFDGFPRTLYEAEKTYPVFKKKFGKKNVYVILLDIDPKTTIFRNTHRKICENEKCRRSIVFSDEAKKWKFCPYCGGKLIIRKLDNPKITKKRLRIFKRDTGQAIAFFAKHGILKKINGEPSVAEVFAEIVQLIKIK